MTDHVFVTGIESHCIIGIEASERLAPRLVRIDLGIEADCTAAGHSDEIGKALDYRAVTERVQRLATASSFHLVEALAEAIAAALLEEFPAAAAVRVRIAKPGAVAGAAEVGVEIERRWGDLV